MRKLFFLTVWSLFITLAPQTLFADTKPALEIGDETWETDIDGSKWTQKTFNYQGKCLQWINQEFYGLTDLDQKRVLNLVKGTGCEKLLMKEK